MKQRILRITALVVACAGCSGPSISRFDVAPPVLCEGEKAVVTWDAKGETALGIQEEPSPEGTANCMAGGRETFALTLAARSGSDEVENRRELVLLQSNAIEPIALRTSAVEGKDVIARGDKNPALWDSRVEVASVRACENRSVTVAHAGRSAVVGATSASDSLAGTPLSGSWEFRSPLTDDELKTPSLRPKELTVVATLRCRK